MWVVSYFTQDGVPATGLSPTIKIRDVESGNIVVNSVSMVEKGDGFYGYDFSAYNSTKDYAIVCDSVTLSGVERYTYASSGEYNESLNSIESTVGTVDSSTTLIRKIQTNRLELLDGNSDNWILYDDDAVTPLLTFDVTDKDGNVIVQYANTPSKRSSAVGIDGATSPELYLRKSIYDADEDGIVSAAETISDGVYTSTASGVKNAVDLAHSSTVYTNDSIILSSGVNYWVVSHNLSTQFPQTTSVYKPTSGSYQDNWVNADNVLTILYYDSNTIRVYNESDTNIAVGKAKIVVN